MEITVKIEGLNQLTESLALIGSALAYKSNMVNTSSEAVNLLLDVTDKVENHTTEEEIKKEVVEKVVTEVVQASEKEEEKKVVAEGPPPVTIEQIREVFVAKNSIKGNTPKLKEILNQFGVRKVTDLEEKDFLEVLKALQDL